MILYKGKNKDCDIIASLEKEFGVIFHPNATTKVVATLKEQNGAEHSQSSKPKSTLSQSSDIDSNTRKEVD